MSKMVSMSVPELKRSKTLDGATLKEAMEHLKLKNKSETSMTTSVNASCLANPANQGKHSDTGSYSSGTSDVTVYTARESDLSGKGSSISLESGPNLGEGDLPGLSLGLSNSLVGRMLSKMTTKKARNGTSTPKNTRNIRQSSEAQRLRKPSSTTLRVRHCKLTVHRTANPKWSAVGLKSAGLGSIAARYTYQLSCYKRGFKELANQMKSLEICRERLEFLREELRERGLDEQLPEEATLVGTEYKMLVGPDDGKWKQLFEQKGRLMDDIKRLRQKKMALKSLAVSWKEKAEAAEEELEAVKRGAEVELGEVEGELERALVDGEAAGLRAEALAEELAALKATLEQLQPPPQHLLQDTINSLTEAARAETVAAKAEAEAARNEMEVKALELEGAIAGVEAAKTELEDIYSELRDAQMDRQDLEDSRRETARLKDELESERKECYRLRAEVETLKESLNRLTQTSVIDSNFEDEQDEELLQLKKLRASLCREKELTLKLIAEKKSYAADIMELGQAFLSEKCQRRKLEEESDSKDSVSSITTVVVGVTSSDSAIPGMRMDRNDQIVEEAALQEDVFQRSEGIRGRLDEMARESRGLERQLVAVNEELYTLDQTAQKQLSCRRLQTDTIQILEDKLQTQGKELTKVRKALLLRENKLRKCQCDTLQSQLDERSQILEKVLKKNQKLVTKYCSLKNEYSAIRKKNLRRNWFGRFLS